MKRLWFGILLMAWASVAALFAYAPTAQAADCNNVAQGCGSVTGQISYYENGVPTLAVGVPVTVSCVGPGQKTTTDSTGTYNFSSVESGGPCTISVSGKAGTIPLHIKSTFILTIGQNLTLNLGQDKSGKTVKGGIPGATVKGGSSASNSSSSDPIDNCDAGDKIFTWIICGLIKLLVDVLDWIRDNIIVPFLQERPLDKNNADVAPVYAVWSAFRNVASVFFILIFFLVIFGTAIGFDNYTIKKVLPRLVAGAILVPFSWYICVVAVDIGNILGQGLLALTSSIIPPADIDFRSSLSTIVLTGTTALIVAGTVGAIATMLDGLLFSMLIAFGAVFFTLVLRKILIIALIVLSPFALLAWILPNTEKWFKEWWNNLFKLILMYPIIMMLFEAGRLFAAVAPGIVTGGNGPNAIANATVPMFQLAALTLPLFLVPVTFSWAGKALKTGQGAIAKVSGAADKRYGKDSERAKDRASERERKQLVKSGDAVTSLGRGYHNFRAGHGFRGGGNNVTKSLRREAAYDKATKDTGTHVGSRTAAGQIPRESANQRINAHAQEASDQLTDARAGRKGILDAHNEAGNPTAAARYEAGVDAEKRKQATAIGEHRSAARAAAHDPQSGREIADAAEHHEDNKQAAARAEVRGTNRGMAATTRDQMNQAAMTGHPISADQARTNRYQTVAAAAETHAFDEAPHTYAQAAGHNEITSHERQEVAAELAATRRRAGQAPLKRAEVENAVDTHLAGQIVEAEFRGGRQEAATEAKNRAELLKIAPESTQEVMEAAEITGRDKAVAEHTGRQALRRVQAVTGETTDSLLDAKSRQDDQARAEVVGTRNQLVEDEDNIARDDPSKAQTTARRVQGARGNAKAGNAQTIGARNASAATYARQRAADAVPGARAAVATQAAAAETTTAESQATALGTAEAANILTAAEEAKHNQQAQAAGSAPLSQAEAHAAVLDTVQAAATEATQRSGSANYGKLNALSEAATQQRAKLVADTAAAAAAAAPGAPIPTVPTAVQAATTRIDNAQQSAVVSLAEAAVAENVQQNLRDQGIGPQDYGQAYEQALPTKQDEAIEKIAKQVSDRPITYTDSKGATQTTRTNMKSLPLDDEGFAILEHLVRTGDTPTKIAALRRIGSSTGGTKRLGKLRTDVFQGTESIKVTPENLYIWEKGTEKVNADAAPDLVRPQSSAFKNVSPAKLVKFNPATTERYVEYLQNLKTSANTPEEVETANARIRELQEAYQSASKETSTVHDSINPEAFAALEKSTFANGTTLPDGTTLPNGTTLLDIPLPPPAP